MSLTVLDTSTSPGPATAAIRATTSTAVPRTRPSACSTSPVCTAAFVSSPSPFSPSAIADAHGERISLSVPDLSLELASGRFCELRGARGGRAGALAFASEIAARDLELRILLVVAPDV